MIRVFPILSLALLLLVAWGGGPAAARQARPEEVRRVLTLLRVKSETPSLEEWRKIGPAANRILVDVANDTELDRVVRLRALASLMWFPSRRSEAVLVGRLHDRRYDAHEKSVAMLAYASAFRSKATGELREQLMSENEELRSGAIRSLGLTGDPRAAEVLSSHLPHETSADLRLLVEASLERLSRGGARPSAAP